MKFSTWQRTALLCAFVLALGAYAIVRGDPSGVIIGALLAGWRLLDNLFKPVPVNPPAPPADPPVPDPPTDPPVPDPPTKPDEE